jgi:hypothetical protein
MLGDACGSRVVNRFRASCGITLSVSKGPIGENDDMFLGDFEVRIPMVGEQYVR